MLLFLPPSLLVVDGLVFRFTVETFLELVGLEDVAVVGLLLLEPYTTLLLGLCEG